MTTSTPNQVNNQPLRLSEAIRLGAMLRPNQARYILFDEIANATCALGAAAEAVGILDTSHNNRYTAKAPRRWKDLVLRPVLCPACDARHERADSVIKHLNNDHWWTRERIADWVQSIEEAERQPVEVAPAVHAEARA